MPGAHSRTKGHSFEREIAREFKDLGFVGARRHLEYQDGEANGNDISNVFPFRVQCKRGKQYASFTKIEEIQLDPTKGEIPLLITKADQKPALVALPWKNFKDFISRTIL